MRKKLNVVLEMSFRFLVYGERNKEGSKEEADPIIAPVFQSM
jgi:hypothetical protein